MPSIDSSSQFLSLKHDSTNGYAKASTSSPFSSLGGGKHNGIASLDQTLANGLAKIDLINGNSTNTQTHHEDEFLRLEKPQQDLLLLHGPRQKYTLERAHEIPELRGDDEILVQTLAIGLNPVDWKGADYGFSQPSYPWINGRDFAGIVVKAPRKESRIKQGSQSSLSRVRCNNRKQCCPYPTRCSGQRGSCARCRICRSSNCTRCQLRSQLLGIRPANRLS
jgi:hypothetical protein